jgi:hypothetical protein
LRQRAEPRLSSYVAFGIAPEELAISVYELDVNDDVAAVEKARPLFHDGLKRIEVWCGSRKVGDIPPRSEQIPDEEHIRNSA